jgi:AraC-like DNA-binding protein
LSSSGEIPNYSHSEFRHRFTEKDKFPSGGDESFRIYKIQDVIRYLKFPLPLQRSNYFEILFISAGAPSSRHCGLKKYEIRPGQLFFKAAGQISSGDIYDVTIEGYFCLLEGDFLSKNSISNTAISSFSFFKYGHSPLVDLTAEDAGKFNDLFHILHTLRVDTDNRQLLAAYMHVLLLEAEALHKKQEQITSPASISSNEQLTSKFLDLVSEHHIKIQQVNKYAEMLHVTPNYLNKAVKQTTGRTALGQIHEMLILEAKVLLKQNEMNVSEIADYLSFEDPSYFTRLFKKRTGHTPLDYRKME